MMMVYGTMYGQIDPLRLWDKNEKRRQNSRSGARFCAWKSRHKCEAAGRAEDGDQGSSRKLSYRQAHNTGTWTTMITVAHFDLFLRLSQEKRQKWMKQLDWTEGNSSRKTNRVMTVAACAAGS